MSWAFLQDIKNEYRSQAFHNREKARHTQFTHATNEYCWLRGFVTLDWPTRLGSTELHEMRTSF